MASMPASGGPSFGLTCVLTLIFTVLLQSLCMAVTYVYLTNELKQLHDKYSKNGIACLLNEDVSSWDPSDEENLSNPCSQVKWQLRKMILRTFEETISTVPEKQRSLLQARDKLPQRVAAHITGTHRRSSLLPTLTIYKMRSGNQISD